MAEEIIIGKLIIDNSELNAAMVSSKKAIVDLENEQKKLKKDTEGLSSANEEQLQSFIDNETELKKLKAEYAANQKSVFELTKAQNGLGDALAKNIKTQGDAVENNKALNAARRQLDTTTTEGAKAIAEINAKIDQNDKLIKDNSSSQQKAATISGNYRQKIFELGGAFGGASAQAIGFVQQGKEILGTVGEISGRVTNSAKNIIGFGNASKTAAVQAAQMSSANTVLATTSEAVAVAEQGTTLATSGLNIAIGTLLLPVTAIVVTLGLVVAVFSSFQPLVDKVEQGVAALTATFNVIKNTILAVANGTKNLKEAFSGLGGEMSKAAAEAAALTKAQQDLDDAMASQEVATARNRAEINKLNVELKNRTKTEAERLAISDKIISKENADFQQRKKLVDEEVRIARQAIATKAQFSEREKKLLKEQGDATKELAESRGGNYDKEFEALNKARLKAIALEDENTTNIEKQYNRRDKLADDAAAKNEARLAKLLVAKDKLKEAGLQNLQNEIEILKLEASASKLTTEQQLANAQKVFDLETALAKKSTSGSDQTKALLEARQNLSSSILEITSKQIDKEIEQQNRIVAAQKATTAEIYDAQSQSAEDLAKAQILLLGKRLLSEKAYADEVIRINAAKNETLTTIQANFDEAETANRLVAEANRKALDDVAFQIKLQDIQDRKATENEIQAALLQANYDNELVLLNQSLANKEVSEELYLQRKSLAEKKFRSDTAKNDKILADQKQAANVDMVQKGIGALQALFGESKALSVASALVNTYTGITAALKEPTLAQRIIGVTFAATTGFAAVKNILKTNKTSSSGGSTSSTPVATSGTGSFVNTSQTETIARVSERPTEQNTVVTPPVLILESLQEAQNNVAIKINSN